MCSPFLVKKVEHREEGIGKREAGIGKREAGIGKREEGREGKWDHAGALNFLIIVISIRLMPSIADDGISDGLM